MNSSVVVIDDDRDYLEILGRKLAEIGLKRVRLEESSLRMADEVKKGAAFDLALIDMTMPEMDGMQLLETFKANSPSTECIMVTAINEARIAVECLNKGAYDYLVKPVATEDLSLAIKRTLERKRLLDLLDLEKRDDLPTLENEAPFKPIITQSKKMMRILKEAELHAASLVPVLITGESGTGKELLARAIHGASPRAQQPFTPINMSSLTSSLFEAEFFGHTKGAFTGAENGRVGYLEYTNKGTLFLDEIGDLPLPLQGKLLRVLQDGEFTRLGSSNRQKVDLRFIAATNENLEQMIFQKRFRKDLYYRIRGGWLHLPPLRERREDIFPLVRKLLEKYYDVNHSGFIEKEALERLMQYPYPGNIRELKSILQSATNLARGAPINETHLPFHIMAAHKECVEEGPASGSIPIRPLAEVEKEHILKAYEQTGENKSKSARLLGIGLNTLRRKLASYGIQ
ncbi:sigma-54-dependent Fis family transcriptional regulator [Desulfosarcina ovata subsp. sediminis]|uniref:Sigma-54-dependent Fis family transcriptional regulator n=1 Tax=Desulfosarcina ovata subsp. sediminis TaxID=885957 RepID=A0A5K7ZTA1_9BACT|nr:sigma-54 dependent transcriptional regulator [Desulfosarcina ovata]BBO83424.1 sigma-54-dependent Fis family transcriptional regulator [Desulfosarcina ovata subsp. sediminis]